MERQRPLDLPGTQDLLDLRLGDVPQPQPPRGGGQEIRGARGDTGHRALVHRALEPPRDEELLLRRDQLGRVDLEQRLPVAHGLAGEIDVQPLDESAELRCDLHDARLVEVDDAHGADLIFERPHVSGAEGDAELADLARRELHRAVGAHIHPFHAGHSLHAGHVPGRLAGGIIVAAALDDAPRCDGNERRDQAGEHETPRPGAHTGDPLMPVAVRVLVCTPRVIAHRTISSPTTRSSSASVAAKSERTRK